MNKKICIVGYSNTQRLAPYKDLSWSIWTFNHRYNIHPRIDLHFDIHNTKGYTNDHQYYKWIMKNKNKIIMNGLDSRFNDVIIYPKEDIIKKYDNCFTSSVAWILAYAMEQNPKSIALYGIDCATESEYISQKAGIMYLLGLAKGLDIEIILPEQCKLFNDKEYWNR